jgi:hypothetical protein
MALTNWLAFSTSHTGNIYKSAHRYALLIMMRSM